MQYFSCATLICMEYDKSATWQMFDHMYRSYDKVNSILSLNQDHRWRRYMASHLPDDNSCMHILDVATGTGEQLISLFESSPDIDKITAIDLSDNMLKKASSKLESKPYSNKVTLQKADATDLPFKDNSFDVVTMTFGIRNVSNMTKALQESARVLKSSGRLLILEFSVPEKGYIKPFYSIYMNKVVPAIVYLLGLDTYPYKYLAASIRDFPVREEFSKTIKENNFTNCEYYNLFFGSVTLYIGKK